MININWWMIGILTGLLMSPLIEIKKGLLPSLLFILGIIIIIIVDILKDKQLKGVGV